MDAFWDEEPEWFETKSDDVDIHAGDDEEDDDEYEGEATKTAQHVVILVDCHRSMFQETRPDPEFPDDDRTIMDVCLSSIRNLIRQKIRVATISRFGKRDGIGVLLFNTRCRSPVVETSFTNTEKQHERRGNGEEFHDDEEEEEDDDEEDDDDDLTGYHTLYSTVHELLPLSPPGIPTVRKIAATLPDFMGERQIDIQTEYALQNSENPENDANDDNDDTTEPSLHQALVRVLRILETADCVKKDDATKILILTSNDHPLQRYSETSEIWRILQTTISNIRDHDIDIAVWPVLGARKIVDTHTNKKIGTEHPTIVFSTFDFSKCYNKLNLSSSFSSWPDEEDSPQMRTYTPSETVDDDWVNHLLDERWKKPRRAFRVSLVWPDWKNTITTKNNDDENPDTYMALDFFRLLQTMEMPSKKPIHQETGRLVSKIIQTVIKDSGQILVERRMFGPRANRVPIEYHGGLSRLRTFVDFGGGNDRVPMGHSDKIQIRKLASINNPPGMASLVLIGFKPKDSVSFFHIVDEKASYFVYPNEEDCKGSTDAFAHLHECMLRKGVVGIGELLTRSENASSRLVLMRPIQEEVIKKRDDEKGIVLVRQLFPPGMLVTFMPYEDEIRTMAEPDCAARSMMDSRVVVASEELVTAAMDLIQSQTRKDESSSFRIGSNIFENAEMLKFWNYVEHVALEEPSSTSNGTKHDTVLDEEKVLEKSGVYIQRFQSLLPEDIIPEKETRKRKLVPDDSGIDWEEEFKNGTISKCKNDDLKKKLRSLGEILTGNKQQLVSRLIPHLEREFTPASTSKVIKTETM